jgi:hypothetical protein
MNGIPVGQASPLFTGPVGSSSSFSSIHVGQMILEEYANMNENDWYAKSLVDLGEYLHAAAILSQQSAGSSSEETSHSANNAAEITQIGQPIPGLSSYGFYLRAYALYMAGERRKEEDYVELQRQVAYRKNWHSYVDNARIISKLTYSLASFHD